MCAICTRADHAKWYGSHPATQSYSRSLLQIRHLSVLSDLRYIYVYQSKSGKNDDLSDVGGYHKRANSRWVIKVGAETDALAMPDSPNALRVMSLCTVDARSPRSTRTCSPIFSSLVLAAVRSCRRYAHVHTSYSYITVRLSTDSLKGALLGYCVE